MALTTYSLEPGEAWTLDVEPVLESWDVKGSPSQQRLERFLNHLREVVRHDPDMGGEEVAVELHVGLPDEVDLLADRDLDNYLFPIARTLRHVRLASATATKGRGPSTVRVGPARRRSLDALSNWSATQMHLTGSAGKSAWKEQLVAGLGSDVERLPDGPVELELCFAVGRGRTAWGNLWKPTIDSLGAILGTAHPARRYTPRDDRITRLGLHRVWDETLQWDVHLGIWWRPATFFGG